MDFVAAWKAISIVFTGAFGILGLLKDFRNKHTKQITKWGYISLAGILISTICGVAAQLKASRDEASQTLRTVTNIQRLLSPLTDAKYTVQFAVACDSATFKQMCNDVSKLAGIDEDAFQDKLWSYWPRGLGKWGLQCELHFFADAKDADAFAKGDKSSGDLDVPIAVKHGESSWISPETFFQEDPHEVGISVNQDPQEHMVSDGRIMGMSDLYNATVIVESPYKTLDVLVPVGLSIRLKTGETIETQALRKFTRESRLNFILLNHGTGTAYRAVLPKSSQATAQ